MEDEGMEEARAAQGPAGQGEGASGCVGQARGVRGEGMPGCAELGRAPQDCAPQGERKTDLRVVKTREAIQAAFERLLRTTPYSQMTVSAIAREARVSRKTFYAHYSSVNDLLEVVAQRVVEEIAHEVQPDGELIEVREWMAEFVRVTLTKLRDNPYWNGNVVQLMSAGSFVEVFRKPLEELCRKELAKRGLAPSEGHEYTTAFLIGGLCAAYETWLSLGRAPDELDAAAELIARAATRGIGELLVPA